MQQRIKFNGIEVLQPDEDGYTVSLATTSTSDSGRTLRGKMKNTPLFTVEAYQLKWTNPSAADCAQILQQVLGKGEFDFYHFNFYRARWETGKFYAANFNMPVYCLTDGAERANELSFQVTGVNPL